MMNSKIRSLLELLRSVSPADLAMCSRGELVELSDATFDVGGEADCELGFRGAAVPFRDELIPH